MKKIPDSCAPCGVYCGACPSFNIRCKGCRSEDKNQKRKSKWNCIIRVCCLEKKKFHFCYECEYFPCNDYTKKLSNSHKGDKRFKYRHELPIQLKKIQKIGFTAWLNEQKTRWRCPQCGGTIKFYHYACSDCGYEKHC